MNLIKGKKGNGIRLVMRMTFLLLFAFVFASAFGCGQGSDTGAKDEGSVTDTTATTTTADEKAATVTAVESGSATVPEVAGPIGPVELGQVVEPATPQVQQQPVPNPSSSLVIDHWLVPNPVSVSQRTMDVKVFVKGDATGVVFKYWKLNGPVVIKTVNLSLVGTDINGLTEWAGKVILEAPGVYDYTIIATPTSGAPVETQPFAGTYTVTS